MKQKNRKTFELSSIKKYKEYERKLWLIPAVWAILAFRQLLLDNLIRFGSNGATTVFCIFAYYLFGVSIISAFPFFIGKIIIKTKIKTTMRNCTITSVQDFDYYRDKLTGLSPATISILTDLEIEQKKDVVASILQYENLGLLVEETDHTYHVTEKYNRCSNLNESDRYLIEHLEKGDFDWENDTQWKQLTMDEAVSEGYITKTEWPRPSQQKEEDLHPKKAVLIKGRLVKLLLGMGWIYWFLNAIPRIMALKPFYEVPLGTSWEEQLNFLYSQPKLLLAFIESIALFIAAMFVICYQPRQKSKRKKDAGEIKGCLVPLVVMLIWIIWIFSVLPKLTAFNEIIGNPEALFTQPDQVHMFLGLIPFYIFSAFIISYIFSAPRLLGIISGNMKTIKRTDYGNQMAECVYGMKNFIHDYSNLNEADKRQVVLWEDYLVYAVVLEENEEIVNEIAEVRREVL